MLLIAHGSRRAEANRDLDVIATALRTNSEYELVATAFLELAEPDIPTGARRCAESGAEVVLMMPYFLSAGAHVTDDLERFRFELSHEFPQIQFLLCPHLGTHTLMRNIVEDRLREGMDRSGLL